MEKHKVSIIIPIYNMDKYLKKCLDSIINQTYKNLEIILIDDGSTDNSKNIIKEYKNKDNRIFSIFQKHLGAPSARNKGIEIATGTYIMFFDSDDELNENGIEILVNGIKDADIITGNYYEIDEKGNPIQEKIFFKNKTFQRKDLNRVILYNSIPGCKLFKTNIIKENNILFDNVKIEQDTNFYIKYIGMSNKFITTNAFIYKYRQTPNSISRTYGLNIIDTITSINKALSFLDQNNKILSDETKALIKISIYSGKIKKSKYFDKKCRNAILQAFIIDLKKINTSKFDKELRKKHSRVLLKYRMCKYDIGIKLMNFIFKIKGAK